MPNIIPSLPRPNPSPPNPTPSMTFAAPLFLIAALAGRRHSGDFAFDPSAAGEESAVSDASLPENQRGEDPAAKTDPRFAPHAAPRGDSLAPCAGTWRSRPITNLGSLWGGANTAVAIVLDNSASMGAIDAERIPIRDRLRGRRCKSSTNSTTATKSPSSRPVGPIFPGLGKLDRTKEAVREILPQCQVGYERADFEAAKVQRAREILDKATTPNKQIFVVFPICRKRELGRRGEGRGERGEGY